MKAPPPKKGGISPVLVVIIMLVVFAIAVALMFTDGKTGWDWFDTPPIERNEASPGGDGSGQTGGGGKPNTCAKNCEDDNP